MRKENVIKMREDIMFCRKCGRKLEDHMAFCPGCGTSVNAGTQQIPPQAEAVKQPAPVEEIEPVGESKAAAWTEETVPGAGKTPDKKRKGILLACAALAVLAVAIGVFSQFSSKGKQEAADADGIQNSQEQDAKESSVEEQEASPEQEGTADGASQEINGVPVLSADTLEGQIQEQIFHMNDASYGEASIDVYGQNYPVGARNPAATWNDGVFYCLEGHRETPGYQNKNICSLVKKELKNAANGNLMQYEIYINPSTNVANKIVSIEYMENGLEITEYYFDNDKKASFIFQYTADNYISTFATPDKFGDRYLFSNDCMVTWRSIADSITVNYILGDAEAERMKNQFARSTMMYYGSLSSEQQAVFDEQESKMLNAAYNTYNTVMSTDGIAHIQGYAYDENNAGIEGAKVEVYGTDFTTLLYCAATDSSGMYTVYVPSQEYEYHIRISKENRTAVNIHSIKMSNDQIGAYQDSVYLFDPSVEKAPLQLTLGDAFTYAADGNGMMPLGGAAVYFREGIHNRYGEIVLEAAADGAGFLRVELRPGVYTMEVKASGYETMYYIVVVHPAGASAYEFYATPTLNENEYAVVLTWGSYPYDLDSHLFTTAGTGTGHIWFGGRTDTFNNYLDVDDTDSYGPETVTILNFDPSKYYKYCVVDFTNCSSGNFHSLDMSYSLACVNVYSSEGLAATYNVPTGQEGVIWEVFEIRNGRITPIQRYYSNAEDKTWWHSDK
jgi:hypothetical protein